MLYEVHSYSTCLGKFEANSSDQAKRKACRYWGRKPSYPWTGIRGLSAKKMKEGGRG